MKNILLLFVLGWNIVNGQSFKYNNSSIVNFELTSNSIKNSNSDLSSSEQRLKIENLELRNGDLLIGYSTMPFKSKEKDFILSLSPAFRSTSSSLNVRPKQNKLKGPTEILFSKQQQQNYLTWSDFIEEYKSVDHELTFMIDYSLSGQLPVAYSVEPDFTKEQRLPHYYMGVASTLSVVSGVLLKSSGNKIYDEYKVEVFQQNQDANITFNKANERKRLGHFMLIAGVVTLGVNGLVYLTRDLIQKKRKKDYLYYEELNTISN